jgi:spoIIIJ-associated protein
MATENFEFTGKTVDDAVAEGLRTLKLRVDQVVIEVLNKGSRGIFGLGSEPALVRLTVRATPQPAPPPAPAPSITPVPIVADPQPVAPPTTAFSEQTTPTPPVVTPLSSGGLPRPTQAAEADEVEHFIDQADGRASAPPATLDDGQPETTASSKVENDADGSGDESDTANDAESDATVEALATDFLGELVRLMEFEATVRAEWRDGADELNEHGDRYLLLDVTGADLGALIGRRGEALDNLQYLLRLMVNQRLRKWQNIVVDVEGYKERRIMQLKQLATRTAAQVAASGRAVSLEPMPPNERRIIHIALRDHPDVYTESTGEGDRRKVHIVTKHSH